MGCKLRVCVGEEGGAAMAATRQSRAGVAQRRHSAPSLFQPSHSPIAEAEHDSAPIRRRLKREATVVHSSPNELRVTMDRLEELDRSVFDRLSHAHYASHGPVFRNPSTFRIEPMHDEAFIGAWMHLRPDLQTLDTSKLLRRQQLVQLLNETRFDSMQRFLSFCVLFHAMGKAVADFWPRASCGLLGYDMSRSQSIMRVATTASPVAGTEVRDRLVEIRRLTLQLHAASTIQRIWRSLRLWRMVRSNSTRHSLDSLAE